MKIVLCGWNLGFDKVGLTKLLRAECGSSLKSAKATTDAVLEGQFVTIEVPDSEVERMIFDLDVVGAKWTK